MLNNKCNNERKENISDYQMCCLLCGYVADENEPYYSESEGMDEDFPLCPKCGAFNIGGYRSYESWGILSEEHRELIKELINESRRFKDHDTGI
jgi:hypothetical protein